MKIIVIDTEFNCDTESNSLIEFGLIELDSNTQNISRYCSYYVKPLEPISSFCQSLTGITNKKVFKQGLEESHLKQILVDKYGVLNKTMICFGDDFKYFSKQEKNIFYKWIDLSELLNFKFNLTQPISLTNSMKLFNLEFVGTQHRALDDAYNTARLYSMLMWNKDVKISSKIR